MAWIIGIDMGGTRIKMAAFDESGTPLGELVRPTFPDGSSQSISGMPIWANTVIGMVGELETRFGSQAGAIGISLPGLPSRDRRSIAYLPNKLIGLEDFDWPSHLGHEHVAVINDAHAALMGEAWIGCARGMTNVVMLTLGTGVGGAAIVDGHLLTGHLGRAGHLGHTSIEPDGKPGIFGVPGTFEDFIGEQTVRARSSGRFDSTRALVTAYEQGDKFASEVWLRSVRVLGVGIVGFINSFDPEIIVIGGGIAQANESLFGPLRSVLDECEWRPGGYAVPMIPAVLGDAAGPAGAAKYALGFGRS